MRDAALIEQIDTAIKAHGMWKRRLYAAISTGRADISAAQACCDDACEFGHWLYGPSFDSRTRAGVSYQEVRQRHAEFHRSAGSVLAYVERGNPCAAQFLLAGEYDVLSEMLTEALIEWKDEVANQAAPEVATPDARELRRVPSPALRG